MTISCLRVASQLANCEDSSLNVNHTCHSVNVILNFEFEVFPCTAAVLKKIHESYMHDSFFRRSLSCIYVITAGTLVTVLNISLKGGLWAQMT